jgi:histidinol-phosphate phosphatase family protein
VRVVFLDRDGVINRNRDDYVKSVEEFELLPGALDALRLLNESGRQVIVVSNQACVAKGLISEETLAGIDRLMFSLAAEAGGKITATYYCTHHYDDGCDCRKPAPGLIMRASRDLGFDPGEAVFVGDAAGDIQAGQAAGCRTVLVLSGRISAADAAALDPEPDYIATDLDEAARWIISTS